MVLVLNAEGVSGGGIPRASSKADKMYQICSELDHSSQESLQTKLMKRRRATKEHSKTNKSVRYQSKSSFSKVLRSIWLLLCSTLRWLAVLVIAILLLSVIIENEQKKTSNILEPEQHTWQLLLFRLLPARFLSRLWGFAMSIEVPETLRAVVYGSFVWKYNCNMTEAKVEDLRHYSSLGELFTRQLKRNVRTISESELVSPTDGKILHFGTVQNGLIEQVKGVTYSLETFLGPEDLPTSHLENSSKSNNTLYHVVIYLGPGDYHHFHSPTNWTIHKRRHFPGDLLSVAPWAARTIPGLFSINERAVMLGSWKYGFFSMAAVGAYNVGSISLTIDETLETNAENEQLELGEYRDKELGGGGTKGLEVKKGERLGGFKLGSTIVLVFRAPSNFHFSVLSGQIIQFGQSLGFSH